MSVALTFERVSQLRPSYPSASCVRILPCCVISKKKQRQGSSSKSALSLIFIIVISFSVFNLPATKSQHLSRPPRTHHGPCCLGIIAISNSAILVDSTHTTQYNVRLPVQPCLSSHVLTLSLRFVYLQRRTCVSRGCGEDLPAVRLPA